LSTYTAAFIFLLHYRPKKNGGEGDSLQNYVSLIIYTALHLIINSIAGAFKEILAGKNEILYLV
jgi:hypothetical protein